MAMASENVVFAAVDRDGDGKLNAADISMALESVGAKVEASTVELLAQGCASNGCFTTTARGLDPAGLKECSWEELCAKKPPCEGLSQDAYTQLMAQQGKASDEDSLAACAGVFGDASAGGKISRSQFMDGLARLGMDCSEDEAKELLSDLCKESDGELSQADFERLMCGR